MPSNKTFRTKVKLAKAAKQNRPIPQWIRLRTDNTIKYNAKRRHWRRTKREFLLQVLEDTNGKLIWIKSQHLECEQRTSGERETKQDGIGIGYICVRRETWIYQPKKTQSNFSQKSKPFFSFLLVTVCMCPLSNLTYLENTTILGRERAR